MMVDYIFKQVQVVLYFIHEVRKYILNDEKNKTRSKRWVL